MPKPMLRRSQVQAQANTLLSAAQNQQQKQRTQQIDELKVDRPLRKPYSKEYIDAIHRLDAGGHVHSQHKVNEIMNTIRNEFLEPEISGILLAKARGGSNKKGSGKDAEDVTAAVVLLFGIRQLA